MSVYIGWDVWSKSHPFYFGLVLSVVTGHRVAWLWFVVAVLGSRRNDSNEK